MNPPRCCHYPSSRVQLEHETQATQSHSLTCLPETRVGHVFTCRHMANKHAEVNLCAVQVCVRWGRCHTTQPCCHTVCRSVTWSCRGNLQNVTNTTSHTSLRGSVRSASTLSDICAAHARAGRATSGTFRRDYISHQPRQGASIFPPPPQSSSLGLPLDQLDERAAAQHGCVFTLKTLD